MNEKLQVMLAPGKSALAEIAQFRFWKQGSKWIGMSTGRAMDIFWQAFSGMPRHEISWSLLSSDSVSRSSVMAA
ncbi:MAG: hypothetical protein JKY56_26230 [Kofleriaceae bacterium]|nr:hypothetical protein [Kofleriaceae bacterium]